eukprot:gene31538-53855_t
MPTNVDLMTREACPVGVHREGHVHLFGAILEIGAAEKVDQFVVPIVQRVIDEQVALINARRGAAHRFAELGKGDDEPLLSGGDIDAVNAVVGRGGDFGGPIRGADVAGHRPQPRHDRAPIRSFENGGNDVKLLRFGAAGAEKPGLLDAKGVLRDLSGIIPDLAGKALTSASLAKIGAIDPESLPAVAGAPRIGACVGDVRNFIAVGLNFADHAAETG